MFWFLGILIKRPGCFGVWKLGFSYSLYQKIYFFYASAVVGSLIWYSVKIYQFSGQVCRITAKSQIESSRRYAKSQVIIKLDLSLKSSKMCPTSSYNFDIGCDFVIYCWCWRLCLSVIRALPDFSWLRGSWAWVGKLYLQ